MILRMAWGRRIILGNWKMNAPNNGHHLADLKQFCALLDANAHEAGPDALTLGIAPPACLIGACVTAFGGSAFVVGAQDVSARRNGAHTGDVSAELVCAGGARFTIVGHSERRRDHGETAELIAAKIDRALEAGLDVVVCVGETAQARMRGETESFIFNQVTALASALAGPALAQRKIAFAYEPVWAIGSGRTPSGPEISAAHRAIRAALASALSHAFVAAPVIYGGSVSAANAGALLANPDMDGLLVGGASLLPTEFAEIIRAGALVWRF
ncbi:MAG TPA: triose-phosphate isomerase [Hyphomonadaceae bacterium]|nr:triose-phosphate isomerase [Hyphomonadaceae bacterium]